MIGVKTYKSFWDYLKTYISGITTVKIVADEKELEKFLRELADKEVVLIAVIPSSDTDYSNLDNKKEDDNSVVYILKKSNQSDMTEAELLTLRDDTQVQITALKKKLYDMACDTDSVDSYTKLARRMVPAFHTDPEYDYLGCNGWSISFKWKTNAYDNAS